MLPNGWVCPYITQNWVETAQHFKMQYFKLSSFVFIQEIHTGLEQLEGE